MCAVRCAITSTKTRKTTTASGQVCTLVVMSFALFGCTFAAAQSASAPQAVSGPESDAQEMLYYVCGQAGLEKTVTSPDPKHPFNLGITFAQQNGAPASDVAVRLRRHGRVLMDFVAGGPHCLFSVPSAS